MGNRGKVVFNMKSLILFPYLFIIKLSVIISNYILIKPKPINVIFPIRIRQLCWLLFQQRFNIYLFSEVSCRN